MAIRFRPNRFVTRRRAVGILGAASLTSLIGYGSRGGDSAISTATAASTTGPGGLTGASCVLIPEETRGPYPLFNDSAGVSTFMRQDVTEGRPGVPMNLLLTILNVNSGCAPIANALVYIWHCDKDGVYSGYRQPGSNAVGQTFCRGTQMTDSNGRVRFTTIYPGWYPGRITHIHFRVYLGKALEATSQLAFPEDITNAVYNSDLYSARGRNSTVDGFADDSVFSDGVQYQLCSMTRNAATRGYDASLGVGIAL